jgi:hypothetical protein
VKVKTFLPVTNRKKIVEDGTKLPDFKAFDTAERQALISNSKALKNFKNKFYGPLVTSSQLNQKKGLKTINIFEKT